MSRPYERYLVAALALAALGAPRPVLGARGRGEAPSKADLAALTDKLKGARSAPEAGPSLRALEDAGAAGFPYLKGLLDSGRLHPEVHYYVLTAALRNPAPEAVALAASQLANEDTDLRRHAARTLERRATRSVASALLEAIPRESEPAIQAMEIGALGRTGHPKAVEVIAGYLSRERPDSVLSSAAHALARLKTKTYIPRILGLVHGDMEEWLIQSLLDAVGAMLGKASDEQVLAWARDPASALRLYAVSEVQRRLPPHHEAGAEERRRLLAEAARSALDDASPTVRQRAVLALAAAWAGPLQYVSDPQAVAVLLSRLEDPDPAVRLGVLEALWNTVMRRGILTTGPPAVPLAPDTMRMLRFPVDWLVFPRYVELLADPETRVRERTAWMLGISTGYWYGYGDIRLIGTPVIGPEVRTAYREMWEQMKDKTPAEYAVHKIDNAVASLVEGERPDLHLSWMRGIRLLSGRDFGWRSQKPPEERAQAVAALAEWWAANRRKHPAEWLVDGLREGGFRLIDDYSLHVLGRWVPAPLPWGALDQEQRARDPEAAVKSILEWWDANRDAVLSPPR